MKIRKPGMAWVGKVLEISPIPDADRIQRAEVVCGKGGKWCGVVRKGDVEEGDVVAVFLPDSIVPDIPALSFMEPRGFRVTMMRLRGCPSEVLIMPIAALDIHGKIPIGTDITDVLNVMKYEKEIPLSLSGMMAGSFPMFIPKTDEPNFQKVEEMRAVLSGKHVAITTKYDGSSQTFYHRDGHLGGCSRNWELRESKKVAVWDIANRYGLPEKLPTHGNFALQWEAVGPKIQGNPLGIGRVEPRLFNVWDIDQQKYLDHYQAWAFAQVLGLPFVWTEFARYADFTDDDLRKMAEGTYVESGRQREGIVIRPVQEMRVQGERLSFKVKNLLYKEGRAQSQERA